MLYAKKCAKCYVEKPVTAFDVNSKTKDGRYPNCKECRYKHRRTPVAKAKQAVYRARHERIKYETKLGTPIKDDLNSREVAFVFGEGYCSYCQKPLDYSNATLDHLVALSRGGENTFENVVGACGSCNTSKQDKPVLLHMLQSCEPYANRKLLERLALRKGCEVSQVYEELVADVQNYLANQSKVGV
ncbi:HNH endonuclease [Mesobacillus subterraneus]|uniref:HNH endonuclease n=1 Tax=Mesobacillus subterraneus TaxID=285983 RepID=UPI00333FC70F